MTTTLMDKFTKSMKSILNAVLYTHHTDICKQVTFSLFEFWFRCNRHITCHIWSITHNKNFFGRAVTLLNRVTLLRFVGSNHNMRCSIGRSLKELKQLVQRFHTIFKSNMKHLWRKIMLIKHSFFAEEP